MAQEYQSLIRRADAADREAADKLFALLYNERHRLAEHALRRPGPSVTLSTTTLLHEAYGWTQDGRALLYATKSDAGTSTVWLVGLGDGEVAGEPRAVVRDIRGFGVAIPLPLANVALEQWDAGGRALILSGGLGTNLLDIVWNSSHLEGTPTLSLD